jgi:hypothetical protein
VLVLHGAVSLVSRTREGKRAERLPTGAATPV